MSGGQWLGIGWAPLRGGGGVTGRNVTQGYLPLRGNTERQVVNGLRTEVCGQSNEPRNKQHNPQYANYLALLTRKRNVTWGGSTPPSEASLLRAVAIPRNPQPALICQHLLHHCTRAVQALRDNAVACGSGTYQVTLSRQEIASKIGGLADEVVERVRGTGPFADVHSAAEFVADQMTCSRRPQFSANETAKDFAYWPGLLAEHAAERCHLGPGARAGLAHVRARSAALPGDPEEAVAALRACLRARHPDLLGWVRAIDIEQALCEFAKYVRYTENGISAMSDRLRRPR